MSGSLLLEMWPGDDIDPLASPCANISDKKSTLLQVSARSQCQLNKMTMCSIDFI